MDVAAILAGLPRRHQRVYRALAEDADNGRQCRDNGALALVAELHSVGASSAIVTDLERRGLIRVVRGHNSRVVTVVATGRSTAGEIRTPRHYGPRAPGAPLRKRPLAVRPERKPDDALVNRPPDRTPCVFCGTRGDLGCRHRRAPAEAPAPIEQGVEG